jgi:hypothetical protein
MQPHKDNLALQRNIQARNRPSLAKCTASTSCKGGTSRIYKTTFILAYIMVLLPLIMDINDFSNGNYGAFEIGIYDSETT